MTQSPAALTEYERLTSMTVDREVVRTYSVLGRLVLIAILHVEPLRHAGPTTDPVWLMDW